MSADNKIEQMIALNLPHRIESDAKASDSDLYNAVLDHYKELNSVQSHYDTQLWLVPGAAVALVGGLYGVAYSSVVPRGHFQVALLLVTTLLFFGFVLKYLNEWAYQTINSMRMAACRGYLGIDLALSDRIANGEKKLPPWVQLIRKWPFVVPTACLILMVIVLIVLAANCWFAACTLSPAGAPLCPPPQPI